MRFHCPNNHTPNNRTISSTILNFNTSITQIHTQDHNTYTHTPVELTHTQSPHTQLNSNRNAHSLIYPLSHAICTHSAPHHSHTQPPCSFHTSQTYTPTLPDTHNNIHTYHNIHTPLQTKNRSEKAPRTPVDIP